MSISSVMGQRQYAYAPEYPIATALNSAGGNQARPAPAGNGADAVVTISAQAHRLYAQSQIAAAQQVPLSAAGGSEAAPVQSADQALEAVSARVRAQLVHAGIGFTAVAEFSAAGGVLPVAGHPKANEIEAVLNADPSLMRDLSAALAMKAHASALQRAAKFTDDHYRS